jgi:serine/threonine-protein kinase RIO1
MSIIDQQSAVQACKDIEQRLMEMPIEELRKAHQRMAIEAHNAEVDAKKAAKNAAKARTPRNIERYRDLRG